MSSTSLFLGVLFGAVGAGYFVYGRKQRRAVALVSGIILSILPFLLSNVLISSIVGVILAIAPFIIRY